MNDILELATNFEKLAQSQSETNVRGIIGKYQGDLSNDMLNIIQDVSDKIWEKTGEGIGYYKVDITFSGQVRPGGAVSATIGFVPAPSLNALSNKKPLGQSKMVASVASIKLKSKWSKILSQALSGKIGKEPGNLSINAPPGEADGTWFVVEAQ